MSTQAVGGFFEVFLLARPTAGNDSWTVCS